MRLLQTRLRVRTRSARWAIGATAAVVLLCGVLWHHAGLLLGGALMLCLAMLTVDEQEEEQLESAPSRRRRCQDSRFEEAAAEEAEEQLPEQVRPTIPATPRSAGDLVDDLLATGRYALLLRPAAKEHLSQPQVVRAVRQLDEAMSLVPAGRVLLGQLAENSFQSGGTTNVNAKLAARNLIFVEPVYLDRFTVSNEQFQLFVDAGGYEQLEFWHEEALPALLDFVDETGHPGPRFWCHGRYPSGEHDFPVVGVSWYEAWAYARWVGKRLPTDAQWVKAGAWPVESCPGRIAQRRYPWGESFDVRRANLWGSGRRQATAVDDFPTGVSVGGVYQLVGNVWEWSASPLVASAPPSLHVPETYKSICGGAFDTYFENQATCHYQSGEHPLTRRRNIGFRLALPMADLEAVVDDEEPVESAQEPDQEAPGQDADCESEEKITCEG